jgi:hypothetical protein
MLCTKCEAEGLDESAPWAPHLNAGGLDVHLHATGLRCALITAAILGRPLHERVIRAVPHPDGQEPAGAEAAAAVPGAGSRVHIRNSQQPHAVRGGALRDNCWQGLVQHGQASHCHGLAQQSGTPYWSQKQQFHHDKYFG